MEKYSDLDDEVNKMLGDFSKKLQEDYGANLADVILYGSRARGDNGKDSDIDVLVVLNELQEYWKEFQHLYDKAYEVSFGSNRPIPLSARPASRKDYESGKTSLLETIKREGIHVGLKK